MGTVLNSLDNMLASAQANGLFTRFLIDRQTTNIVIPTAANPAGYNGVLRYPNPFTMPSIGAGLSGVYFPTIDIICDLGTSVMICGIETLLGTLTVSGNTFSAGSTMPMKPDPGIPANTIQTSSLMAFAVATTAVTAAAGTTLTTTYTNQDGSGGQSCAFTIPVNPTINTGFFLNPHLASGDVGMQSVTGMSISAGSAGVFNVYGILPLAISCISTAPFHGILDPLLGSNLLWKVQAGDTLAFYRLSTAITAGDMHAHLVGVADN